MITPAAIHHTLASPAANRYTQGTPNDVPHRHETRCVLYHTRPQIPPARAVVAWTLLAMLAQGCGEDGVNRPGGEDGPPFVFQTLDNLPTLYDLNAVWAAGPNDVIAVGRRGTAVHFDGTQWSEYFVEPNQSLWGVWGASVDDVFAVGDGGTVARKASPQWIGMTSGTTQGLRGVWGTAADDVFAVGLEGTILHYDGAEWTQMSSPTARALFAVWGRASDDVFAVGLAGTILQYDGVGWAIVPSGTDETLAAISGDPAGMVVAVGNRGVALRNDGDAWHALDTGSDDVLQSVCVVATDLAFAAGANGTVLRYNGIDWIASPTPTTAWLFGITGSGRTDVTAVGAATALHYDGTGWRPLTRGALPSLRCVWPADTRSAVAFGLEESALNLDGEEWRHIDIPAQSAVNINAAWGTSANNIYAVGDNGRVMHFDGSQWLFELNLGVNYRGVWGAWETDVWVVGDSGRIVYGGGGQNWVTQLSATTRSLYGVWGESEQHVFAVGVAGEIVELADNRWTRLLKATDRNLLDVCGVEVPSGGGEAAYAVYAVGAEGTILRRDVDTGDWEAMDSPVSSTLFALGVARGDAVFAAGSGGVVLTLDRGEWKQVASTTSADLYDIAATPGGRLFVVGGHEARDPVVLFYGAEGDR